MKISRSRFLQLVAVSGLSVLGACDTAQSESTADVQYFRYAENQTDDYPTTRAGEYFAELVAERTEGRLQIIVFPNAELGDETSTIEQTQLGFIDFVRVGLGTFSEFVEKLNVVQMPFLYEDAAHMWRVLDGEIGQSLREELDSYGVYGLSWFDAGARSFYSTAAPLETLADFDGAIIRVQESSLMEDLISALGAKPVQVVYQDVYASLQSGEIDAAENNFPSYETMSHYEVAPYFFQDEHIRVPELQLVNKNLMESLSEEDQAIIKQAALECAEYERVLWSERETESREKVLAAGTVLSTLSDSVRETFVDATQELYEKYCANYLDFIEEIRAT